MKRAGIARTKMVWEVKRREMHRDVVGELRTRKDFMTVMTFGLYV